MLYCASCFNKIMKKTKAQMKIQEMAFVLVAIMVLFAIVAIFYFKISLSGISGDVETQRAEEANELVRKIAGTPEFAFTAFDCDNCIDLDKAMIVKELALYKGFWGLDNLKIEVIYPNKSRECTRSSYPDCGTLNIVNNSQGITRSAYVALCRQEFKRGNYVKCELGRISASGKNLGGTE